MDTSCLALVCMRRTNSLAFAQPRLVPFNFAGLISSIFFFRFLEATIKSRWKGLRDTFRLEIKKILAYRKNKTMRNRPIWQHYHRLIFLQDQMAPRLGMPTWGELEYSNKLQNSNNSARNNNRKNNHYSNEESSSNTDNSNLRIIDDNNHPKIKILKQGTPVNKFKVILVRGKANSQQLQSSELRSENDDKLVKKIVNEYSQNGLQNLSSSTDKKILIPKTIVSSSGVIGTTYQILGSLRHHAVREESSNSESMGCSDPNELNFVTIKEEHVDDFVNDPLNSSSTMRNLENSDMDNAKNDAEIMIQNDTLHENVNSTVNNVNPLEEKQHDDNYHFLMSLLPYMKKLTDERGMSLRMQLQELVYKEVYKK